MVTDKIIIAAEKLRDDVEVFSKTLVSEGLVDYVYNPLKYAWEIHLCYLKMASDKGAKTLLLGMNPGPHGMGQMGIPFAATSIVRDLLDISGIEVDQPLIPHPKRPVIGLDYPREEVSGTRLWGLLAETYGDSRSIFEKIFILNHCPLMLLDGERATNITPDKISGETVRKLLSRCDDHLLEVIEILDIECVIGVGKFAEKRARAILKDSGVEVKGCWHPSPASPLANRNGGKDWKENVSSVLP
tara:strand:+ start:13085 stop:13816 length:732 start_codon:yes stop_codon:yes gene_type:complete